MRTLFIILTLLSLGLRSQAQNDSGYVTMSGTVRGINTAITDTIYIQEFDSLYGNYKYYRLQITDNPESSIVIMYLRNSDSTLARYEVVSFTDKIKPYDPIPEKTSKWKYILISIISIVGLLFIWFVIMQNHKYKKFQKSMKIGNGCEIFMGEVRTQGRIQKVDGNEITVLTFFDGEQVRHRSGVYPI